MYIIGMSLTGFAWLPEMFLLGGVFFGFAVGICSPTAFAWTVDLSREGQRGRALATMYISLEAGIGSGALLSGWIYSNEVQRIPYAFGAAVLLAFTAFVYLQWLQQNYKVQAVE